MPMSRSERGAFYTNVIVLFCVVGILFIAISSLYIISLNSKRRKKSSQNFKDKKNHVNAETGSIYEETFVGSATHEKPKHGGSLDMLKNEYTINKVTPDATLKSEIEEKVKTIQSVSKIVVLDQAGRMIGVEEEIINVKEKFEIPEKLRNRKEAGKEVESLKNQISVDKPPVNESQVFESSTSKFGDVSSLKPNLKDSKNQK